MKFDHKYGAKPSAAVRFLLADGHHELLRRTARRRQEEESRQRTPIAIVYVEGPIVLGVRAKRARSSFGGKSAASTPIRKALDEAADDDTIKAVVLRVNSPGGSATASDIILDATKRVKAKKPLVVSMGNVAGSGGYYVACAVGHDLRRRSHDHRLDRRGRRQAGHDRHVEQDRHHVGRPTAAGQNAAILSSARSVHAGANAARCKAGWTKSTACSRDTSWRSAATEAEETDRRAGRRPRLHRPAGARAGPGRQASARSTTPIKFAAEQAKIEKYEVRVVPEPKTLIELLMRGVNGGDSDDAETTVAAIAGPQASLLNAALPYLRGSIRRTQLIERLFRQLETLNHEGAVLMMPELMFGGSSR